MGCARPVVVPPDLLAAGSQAWATVSGVAAGCARFGCSARSRALGCVWLRSLHPLRSALGQRSEQSERSERSERSKKSEKRPVGPQIRKQPQQSEAKCVQWDPELEHNPHRRCRVDCSKPSPGPRCPPCPLGRWVAGSLGRWGDGSLGRWGAGRWSLAAGRGVLVAGRWSLVAGCWALGYTSARVALGCP